MCLGCTDQLGQGEEFVSDKIWKHWNHNCEGKMMVFHNSHSILESAWAWPYFFLKKIIFQVIGREFSFHTKVEGSLFRWLSKPYCVGCVWWCSLHPLLQAAHTKGILTLSQTRMIPKTCVLLFAVMLVCQSRVSQSVWSHSIFESIFSTSHMDELWFECRFWPTSIWCCAVVKIKYSNFCWSSSLE